MTLNSYSVTLKNTLSIDTRTECIWMWNTGNFHAGAQLNDKFYSMMLIKNDLYGLVDYMGLVDWAYKYMSKKPHCKERTRLFNLAEKKAW